MGGLQAGAGGRYRFVARWLATVCESLSKIATVFAAHGRYLPDDQLPVLEHHYMLYRDAYDRSLSVTFCQRGRFQLGLASWAIQANRLLFPVRPKQHLLEHLRLSAELPYGLCHPRIMDYCMRFNAKYTQCMLDEDMIHRASRFSC